MQPVEPELHAAERNDRGRAAARNQDKAVSAADDIRAGVPEASLELVELDLSSQSSVREAAAKILEGHGRIDILVNNAGVMGIPERRTEDGFEMQLATNHLGHYALTVRKPILRRIGMHRAIARLWEVSERATGLKLEVGTPVPAGS